MRTLDPVMVRLVAQHGDSALVEWSDPAGAHRAYVPAERVRRGIAEREDLAAGIPYGEAWELLPLGAPGASRVAEALRAHGIWTAEDATQVNRVRAALAEAYSADLAIILNAIRQR